MPSCRSLTGLMIRKSPLQMPLCKAAVTATYFNRRLIHKTPRVNAVETVEQHMVLDQRHQQKLSLLQPELIRNKMLSTQLNILRNTKKPSFYEAVAEIMKLREQYIQDRGIFIKARVIKPLLLGLGATEEDTVKLASVSDNLEDDPTLQYRKTRNSRFCLDFDTKSIRRLEFQPFILSVDEDFHRHDSGKVRSFDEIQNNIQLNTAFQALLVFKAMIINGMEIAHRPNLEYNTNKWICTMFNTRTFTTPDLLGEPAAEGIHADGVDHTMTTFLGATNLASNAGTTFMHSMDETTGIKLSQASPDNILACHRHTELLDTLLVIDHERKHSVTSLYPVDKAKRATRDMFVIFSRRPYAKSHVAASMDSLKPHLTLPMEIPLFAPGEV